MSTIVMGQAASAAAVLSLAGAKGKRYAFPHARILLHQPYGGVEGQAVALTGTFNGIEQQKIGAKDDRSGLYAAIAALATILAIVGFAVAQASP